MTTTTYICSKCGYSKGLPGNCPECSEKLVERCAGCGNHPSECDCK